MARGGQVTVTYWVERPTLSHNERRGDCSRPMNSHLFNHAAPDDLHSLRRKLKTKLVEAGLEFLDLRPIRPGTPSRFLLEFRIIPGEGINLAGDRIGIVATHDALELLTERLRAR